MLAIFVVALGIVAAFLLLIPSAVWVRRMAGYQTIMDVFSSWYVVSTYAATGAASGLATAVLAALLISITIRLIKFFIGYERYAVDGDERLASIVAAGFTQAVRWLRALFFALWKGGEVQAPEALKGEWVRHNGPAQALWERMMRGFAGAMA